MNKTWTILDKGRTADTSIPYARKTGKELIEVSFNPAATVSSIIPETNIYVRYYYIERMVQLVMGSPLREDLLALDPLNTYNYSVTPKSGIVVTNNTSLYVTYNSHKSDRDIPSVSYDITLDVAGEKIEVSSEYGSDEFDLNMNNGLSDMIDISPAMSIRLQGELLPGEQGALINIQDDIHPVIDIAGVLASAKVPKWYDRDLHETYLNGTIVEKLSAVILNTVKGVLDAD